MAEKSEGGKPSDFFIGVVDLFAILLPGALLVFFLKHQLSCAQYCALFGDLQEGIARWVVYLVASYILGHFIFAVGSFFLDDLYDVSYKKWFKERKQLSQLTGEVEARLKSWGQSAAEGGPTQTARRGIPDTLIEEEVFNLTTAFVRVQSASAAAEIDRVEADSKFFRSLTTLQVMSWPLFAGTECWWVLYAVLVALLTVIKVQRLKSVKDQLKGPNPKGLPLSFLLTIPLAVVAVIVSCPAFHALPAGIPWIIGYVVLFLSLWRFMETRMKRSKLAYEAFIILSATPSLRPESRGGERA